MIQPARSISFSVLLRVEKEKSWAGDLLRALSEGLEARDAGLASELVFGPLRYQAQLDHLIQIYSGKLATRLDAEVRIALRMGIYQLRYLDRVPGHAAVGESVELVKKARKHSAAGFVNAVLRKVDRKPVAWPSRSIALSLPQWLLTEWDQRLGEVQADRIAESFLRSPETYIRLTAPPMNSTLCLEPCGVPGAYRVVSGDPSGYVIQDVGSQSIVHLLALERGQSFLDLCAAPGNKTAQALEYGVEAIACELHLHRARQMWGFPRVVLDARQSLPFRCLFDRVLVDAPCSGTGTLGRNPEIRWQLQPSDITDLAGRQTAILRNALTVLRPGGRLVYSTCSLERQENEDVLERVLESTKGAVKLLETKLRTPGTDPGDGFFAAVLTSN